MIGGRAFKNKLGSAEFILLTSQKQNEFRTPSIYRLKLITLY